jgi:hypothetical protein
MTQEQVTRAKGRPTQIDYSASDYFSDEKWIYQRGASHHEALYFQDGKLILWRDEEKPASALSGDGPGV